jgi:uncharacterized protein YbaP (TraB family)
VSNNPFFEVLTGGIRGVANTLRTLFAVVVIAALAGCYASEEKPEAPAGPGPLLYEIANADGTVEGWMLGTIHLLPDDVNWRTAQIDDVVKKADFLVVEIADLDDTNAIGKLFVELGTTPGQPDIVARVPSEDRPALLNLIKRTGLSPNDFSSIETWAAALLLAQGNAVGSADNGVDKAILADFAGRDIREFEGAFAQLAIFDTLAEEDQRVLLTSTVEDPAKVRKEAQDLLDAWLNGDDTTIDKLTTTGAMADPELRSALLVDRNNDWVRKLVPMLRTSDKPLVAVGAAHLVGKDGLPALLEARGYTVRRLGATAK